MTTDYWERVKETLFNYSNEQEDVNKARLEWRYFGQVEDNRETCESAEEYHNCELCDHPNIRWSFLIRNIENDNELKVGSECILKFIEVDVNGDIIHNPIEKKQILKKHVRQKIATKKQQAVIHNLLELKNKCEDFPADSFIDRLDTKNGFTLKQIKYLLLLFNRHKINYNLQNYKLNFRKIREREQLDDLADWQYQQLKSIIPKRYWRAENGK
jgi:hypothetical protein